MEIVLTAEQREDMATFGTAELDVYGKGPALLAAESMQAAAIDRVQTKMLLDEYRAQPVGNRLAAVYWHLQASVSPIALEASRRARVQ